MKGISKRGRRNLWALALSGFAAGSMAVSAQEPDARQQRNADTLKRFAEVMVGMGRNEQCKVLDESRSKRYSDDVAKITMALEKQKEISGQQLLGVIIDATAATGAPESAAGCDEASRQLVEAGSEKARNWAEEIRRGRSRSNSTQGK